jgi:hypothetical protein
MWDHKDAGLEFLGIKNNTFMHKGNVNCLIKTFESSTAINSHSMAVKVKTSVEEAMREEPDKTTYVVIGMGVSDNYDTLLAVGVVNKDSNFGKITESWLELPLIGNERNPVFLYVVKADSDLLEKLDLYIMDGFKADLDLYTKEVDSSYVPAASKLIN